MFASMVSGALISVLLFYLAPLPRSSPPSPI
jgi:hypothetical protein